MRGCLVVKATQSELHYSRLWKCGWRKPVDLLISPSLPTFPFPSKPPLLFWQYFSAVNKIQTILIETPLQNPTYNENLIYMMSFILLFREWCILTIIIIITYYYVVETEEEEQWEVSQLGGTSEEDISAESWITLRYYKPSAEKKNARWAVRKRKFFRGTTRRWLALDKNQCLPFLMGSFLYPANEKFCEGMVNF